MDYPCRRRIACSGDRHQNKLARTGLMFTVAAQEPQGGSDAAAFGVGGTCSLARDRPGDRAGQDQDRRDRHPVGTGRGARRTGARRLCARGQGPRRQDGRQGCRGRGRRRRTEAGRRRHQSQGPARARQGRFRRRPDLLQHPAGDPQAGHRYKDVPDQPERRTIELRRQGMQSVLLRDLVPERSSA